MISLKELKRGDVFSWKDSIGVFLMVKPDMAENGQCILLNGENITNICFRDRNAEQFTLTDHIDLDAIKL